jgi:hypothetical protein
MVSKRRASGRAVPFEHEHIAELEFVFELYCELWELASDLPRRDALHFVLDELAHCGLSEDVVGVARELRGLPFVESAAGAAGDRDSTWFGLQIMLNQLLLDGKRLLSPALLAQATGAPSDAPSAADVPLPAFAGRDPVTRRAP